MAVFLGRPLVGDCVQLILDQLPARDRNSLAQVDRRSYQWVSRRSDYLLIIRKQRQYSHVSMQFIYYCYRGYFFLAREYYWQKIHSLRPSEENTWTRSGVIWRGFACACRYGHYHLAQWLYSLEGYWMLRHENSYAYRVTEDPRILEWLGELYRSGQPPNLSHYRTIN